MRCPSALVRLPLWSRRRYRLQGKGFGLSLGLKEPWLWIGDVFVLVLLTPITAHCGYNK